MPRFSKKNHAPEEQAVVAEAVVVTEPAVEPVQQAEPIDQFTTPEAREIYRSTGNIFRAQSVERYNLGILEEERIAFEERQRRHVQRVQEEMDAKNPVLLRERAEAEEQTKRAEQSRLQTAQKSRQEAEAKAIKDNADRVQREGLAADAITRASRKAAPSSPSAFPKPPALIPLRCSYCGSDRNEGPCRSWCRAGLQ